MEQGWSLLHCWGAVEEQGQGSGQLSLEQELRLVFFS